MTTFTEAPVLAAQIIELANKATYKDRYHGPPHVTDLTGCLRKAWARRRGVKGQPMTEDEQTMLLTGHAHHMLIQAAKAEGPGEWEVEKELRDDTIPVQGTVDVVMRQGSEVVPLEIKTTRASAKKGPDNWQHYIEQIASYCLLVGANQAYLGILHLLGDYSGAKLPKWRMWKILFTLPELEAWRNELQRRARILAQPGLPALDEHQTWECGYCPLLVTRGGFCEGGDGRDQVFFPMSTRIQVRDYSEDEES